MNFRVHMLTSIGYLLIVARNLWVRTLLVTDQQLGLVPPAANGRANPATPPARTQKLLGTAIPASKSRNKTDFRPAFRRLPNELKRLPWSDLAGCAHRLNLREKVTGFSRSCNYRRPRDILPLALIEGVYGEGGGRVEAQAQERRENWPERMLTRIAGGVFKWGSRRSLPRLSQVLSAGA
jgi:hypothetical protein